MSVSNKYALIREIYETMKIAVLADIHSNHIALEACLKEAKKRRVQGYLFLGDYLGELAYPEKTLEILDQLKAQVPCVLIRGNKEDYWIRHARQTDGRNWQRGSSSTGMLAYVYERLTPAQIESFEEMPIAKEIHVAGLPAFVICHGSPWRADESLREDHAFIREKIGRLKTELTVCGHFHIQCAYTRSGKKIVNPGAVGVPLNSGGLTQFMMLSGADGHWEEEFISLPYDQERAIREMDEERLYEQAPAWYRMTKEILRGGSVTHKMALIRAHDLYEKDTGINDWSEIPEIYWERTLTAFGIPM